jgi:hypothetical protein
MRTLIGLPERGMVGVKSGATVIIRLISSRSAFCAASSILPGKYLTRPLLRLKACLRFSHIAA